MMRGVRTSPGQSKSIPPRRPSPRESYEGFALDGGCFLLIAADRGATVSSLQNRWGRRRGICRYLGKRRGGPECRTMAEPAAKVIGDSWLSAKAPAGAVFCVDKRVGHAKMRDTRPQGILAAPGCQRSHGLRRVRRFGTTRRAAPERWRARKKRVSSHGFNAGAKLGAVYKALREALVAIESSQSFLAVMAESRRPAGRPLGMTGLHRTLVAA